MSEKATALSDILRRAPVVPVLSVEEARQAVPLARALVAGGLPVLEITLRTEAALAAIEAIARDVGEAVVGAGTVLTADQLSAVAERGARFAVSPGATPNLLAAAARGTLPLLPGAATASEVMRLLEAGHELMKFFPAEPAGGIAALKALAAPLPQARFCPTGGITAESAAAYLALPNVVCVGGSWVAPAEAVRRADWERITGLAKAAAALAKDG